jgi:hypothetical protein
MAEVQRPTESQVNTLKACLEAGFPRQVGNPWWDRASKAQVFEIDHGNAVHHVMIPYRFFRESRDYSTELDRLGLAERVREARDQNARIILSSLGLLVVWEGARAG